MAGKKLINNQSWTLQQNGQSSMEHLYIITKQYVINLIFITLMIMKYMKSIVDMAVYITYLKSC
jgi:hypothetical protein